MKSFQNKIFFITIDGLGDDAKTNKKTPLEIARTPNLDFLASQGSCGLVSTVGKKIAPESDIALHALLGYDPKKYYKGRGPLEALGANISFKKGNLVLRANFATINSERKIIDRRVGRNLTTKEALELAKAINSKVKLSSPFLFKSIGEHRGILVIKGDFSANISNTDPGYVREGIFGVVNEKISDEVLESKPLDNSRKSQKSADIINDFTYKVIKVLENHQINKKRVKKGLKPANIVLLRDAGTELPNFFSKKKSWLAVVGYPLEVGLAKCSGMKVSKINYPEVKTGDIYKYLYKCLKAEIKKALEILRFYDSKKISSLWFHFKPIDIPGHDGRKNEKIKMIEILDKEFFKKIKENLEKYKDVKIIITADHATPFKKRLHSDDPVPLLFYNGKDKDKVKKFGEHYCKKGSIGHIIGKEVLSLNF